MADTGLQKTKVLLTIKQNYFTISKFFNRFLTTTIPEMIIVLSLLVFVFK